MRKILAGVLGVAGLVAVVLVASAGPATAQTVQKFSTDRHPGTYTVSWSTSGGCDPSKPGDGQTLATDGASGSVSRTVPAPAGSEGQSVVGKVSSDYPEGSVRELSVSTGSHCTYKWSASFESNLPGSKGIRCMIRGAGDAPGERDGSITIATGNVGGDQDLTVSTGEANCTSVRTINVDVPRPKTSAGALDQPSSGAILHTTFSVTATPVKNSNKECKAVTGETTVDDKKTTTGDTATDDDTVGAQLKVLGQVLSVDGTGCDYDVVLEVPAGFAATSTGSEKTKATYSETHVVTPASAADTAYDANTSGSGESGVLDATDCGLTRYVDPNSTTGVGSDTASNNTKAVTVSCSFDITPNSAADASDAGTAVLDGSDCGLTKYVDPNSTTGVGGAAGTNTKAVTVSCSVGVETSVKVAVRDVYILQNVVGDAGGANATYSLTEDKDCGIPGDLPRGLTPSSTGGIQQTKSTTVVELREGFFNISGAVMNPASPSEPAHRIALNKEADACVVKAAVSGLPGHCAAAAGEISADLATGVDAKNRAIVRFDVTCAEPEPEAPADDGADMDAGDGADMDAGDGGDMMGGDGADMGGDGADMGAAEPGPEPDMPTG